MVVSEVNKITPDGLPSLLIENAPPEIKTSAFPLTRPEIYYGESTQDPVFVHTAREEFDYPSGDQNKYSTYKAPEVFLLARSAENCRCGFPGRAEYYFHEYLTGQSRMMIHRNVRDRLAHMAGFLQWDPDPYLVITDDGRLVWMADGYTTSQSHPYAATIPVTELDEDANYIRNAVKATVDAYTGEVSLYVFDPSDPIILSFEKLFPKLFRPASEMPPDLRRHARYPEFCFVPKRKRTVFFICGIRRSSTTKRSGRSRTACRASRDSLHRCSRPTWWQLCPERKIPNFCWSSFQPPGKRQFDWLDGRSLRRRSIGETWSISSSRNSS